MVTFSLSLFWKLCCLWRATFEGGGRWFVVGSWVLVLISWLWGCWVICRLNRFASALGIEGAYRPPFLFVIWMFGPPFFSWCSVVTAEAYFESGVRFSLAT